MLKAVHLAGNRSQLNANGPFVEAASELVDIEILEKCREMTEEQLLEKMRQADIILSMWGSRTIPAELADDPGQVKYILHLTGTCRPYVPIELIRSDIPVTNWGNAPALCVAEGAMALLLSVLKDLKPRAKAYENGEWRKIGGLGLKAGTLHKARLGIYGCGSIAHKFIEMVLPFQPSISVFDPYSRHIPAQCAQVDSLDELFASSDIIALHVGLNDETEKSVTRERLAMLPDNGVIINTSRGEIIDQEALFDELRSGRLRAGLDVLDNNDTLPQDHEARHWPNLILSCHDIANSQWPVKDSSELSGHEQIALANLKRFLNGEPLEFIVDEHRYQLST